MQIGLILLALAFPLLELAVLIKVGQVLGLWWTVLLLVGTGVAGGLIVHAQGLSAARRAAVAMSEGRPPVEPAMHSLMLMLAGALLLIPGLLSDLLALPLLIPGVRTALARWGLRRFFSIVDVRVETREWRGPGQAPGDGQPGGGQRRGGGQVIEGEWERVEDERPPDKPVEGDKGRRS